MFVCGEDLGMIPSCVHPTMADLGVVGEQSAILFSSAQTDVPSVHIGLAIAYM